MDKNSTLVTTQSAAKSLGYCQAHIRRLISNGKIKAIKVGNSWAIMTKDLNKFKEKKEFKDGKKQV